jgi:hypothetical protein
MIRSGGIHFNRNSAVRSLLLAAVGLGVVGGLIVAHRDYRVTIILEPPAGGDYHGRVESSLPGTVMKGSTANVWTLRIPSSVASHHSSVVVTARRSDFGMQGARIVRLAWNHSPEVKIPLDATSDRPEPVCSDIDRRRTTKP